MPEIRTIVFIGFRISFVTLIAVLMILWIVLGVQTVNEVKQIEAQNKNERNKLYDRRTFERMKGMTIFNTILDESIALLAVIGLVLNHRYIVQTSMTLLAIIWFIAQYRISDQLWYGSPVMIASHIIHFFIICLGLSFTHFVKESVKEKENASKVSDGITTSKTA